MKQACFCLASRFALVALFASACNKPKPTQAEAPTSVSPLAARRPAVSFPGPATLLLAQAQFEPEPDEHGAPVPGPAKLLMLTRGRDGFTATALEDPESRVFHKAACVDTEAGERLLTIGGTDALLKLWRVHGGAWTAETLWHPKFGGKWDRLRDFEIADLDGDGSREIVIATHDQGVIAIVSRAGGAWHADEIYRKPDTFIHEIEIGNLAGEGWPEIFATESFPNKADASQPGGILAFFLSPPTGYVQQEVASFANTHAKEILVADLDSDGQDELYAAIEAPRKAKGGRLNPVEVRRYAQTEGKRWTSRLIASLPRAVQARVLLPADLTGSGQKELVVTTLRDGIWRLIPGKSPNGAWTTAQIDAESSGFEHAAAVADLDGDGRLELYVAADDQDEVRQYVWHGTRFERRVIYRLNHSDLTWNILPCAPKKL
jgi:hypothetical protein